MTYAKYNGYLYIGFRAFLYLREIASNCFLPSAADHTSSMADNNTANCCTSVKGDVSVLKKSRNSPIVSLVTKLKGFLTRDWREIVTFTSIVRLGIVSCL